MTTIAFIGAGNIAKAILGGYHKANPEAEIWATDPIQAQLDSLPEGIKRATGNHDAVARADVIILCVKPNMMAEICQDLTTTAANKLFVSVAAGITTDNMRNWLGPKPAIVRCMPNTPALVGEGMTGLFASEGVDKKQKDLVTTLLNSVGKTAWFDNESDLDIVTAVSGSGPAYFFLMLEAMQKAAEDMGLAPDVAQQLCAQTALGAAKMAILSEFEPGTLRQNVTSPGGTTAAALDTFNQRGFSSIVAEALQAAESRSKALSVE